MALKDFFKQIIKAEDNLSRIKSEKKEEKKRDRKISLLRGDVESIEDYRALKENISIGNTRKYSLAYLTVVAHDNQWKQR